MHVNNAEEDENEEKKDDKDDDDDCADLDGHGRGVSVTAGGLQKKKKRFNTVPSRSYSVSRIARSRSFLD